MSGFVINPREVSDKSRTDSHKFLLIVTVFRKDKKMPTMFGAYKIEKQK